MRYFPPPADANGRRECDVPVERKNKEFTMKNTVRIVTAAGLIMMLAGCGKKETAAIQNMEDVYREEGIPVRTRTIREQDFSTYVTFTSSLKGVKESIGSSLVSDTVEEVLAEVGDYVEKDQPIVRFPKSNPTANYYQAEAGFKAAEQAFRRIENLYESNGVSRQSYDDARTQYEVQSANWKTVNDMVVVKAPISGYITRLNIHPADNVRPGDSLFTISNYDRLTSVVWVSDHEIGNIEKGQRAFAEWEGSMLTGEVTRVDLAKDARMKAFAVEVRFGNTEHSVPSGVTADIDIETSLTPGAMVLHRKEILSDSDSWYVYLDRDGYSVRRDIQVGPRQGMYYQVAEGLSPGDRLITEGQSMVRNNSVIRVTGEPAELARK